MVVIHKQEIIYIIKLLNKILDEPKFTTTDLHGNNSLTLQEMFSKLNNSVNINIPTIIKILKDKL